MNVLLSVPFFMVMVFFVYSVTYAEPLKYEHKNKTSENCYAKNKRLISECFFAFSCFS